MSYDFCPHCGEKRFYEDGKWGKCDTCDLLIEEERHKYSDPDYIEGDDDQ